MADECWGCSQGIPLTEISRWPGRKIHADDGRYYEHTEPEAAQPQEPPEPRIVARHCTECGQNICEHVANAAYLRAEVRRETLIEVREYAKAHAWSALMEWLRDQLGKK